MVNKVLSSYIIWNTKDSKYVRSCLGSKLPSCNVVYNSNFLKNLVNMPEKSVNWPEIVSTILYTPSNQDPPPLPSWDVQFKISMFLKSMIGFFGSGEKKESELVLFLLVQPRYVVNQVTAGDYDCPRKVLKFLTDLHASFRMLNLRNDFLRKKFDGMTTTVLILYGLCWRI